MKQVLFGQDADLDLGLETSNPQQVLGRPIDDPDVQRHLDDKFTHWVADIAKMHTKFGVNPIVRSLDKDKLKSFLEFRIKFLQEELTEMRDAFSEGGAKAADEIVDALIDLCVVAIGTLDAFDVDAYTAWNRVTDANMQKEPGVNPNRPNEFGFPDMVKPAGWKAPTHVDNVGLLSKLF